MEQIGRIFIHFAGFFFSFYCLSGLDFSKFMLNNPKRNIKAYTLLILMSLGLGYLAAQFILNILYK